MQAKLLVQAVLSPIRVQNVKTTKQRVKNFPDSTVAACSCRGRDRRRRPGTWLAPGGAARRSCGPPVGSCIPWFYYLSGAGLGGSCKEQLVCRYSSCKEQLVCRYSSRWLRWYSKYRADTSWTRENSLARTAYQKGATGVPILQMLLMVQQQGTSSLHSRDATGVPVWRTLEVHLSCRYSILLHRQTARDYNIHYTVDSTGIPMRYALEMQQACWFNTLAIQKRLGWNDI
jgi:hypothetical protein